MKKHALLVVFAFVVFSLPPQAYPAMEDYTAIPPFCERTVAPNILLLIDLSSSMRTSAYQPYNPDPEKNQPNLYDGHKVYYGYFKTDKFYKYDADAQKFVENGDCDWWNRLSDNNWGPEKIPGSFLNWATMSRIDILRKVLTGGKSEPESDQLNPEILVSESSSWTCYYGDCEISVEKEDGVPTLTINDYDGTCLLGTLSSAHRKVDLPGRTKSGIVQDVGDTDHDGQWDSDAPRFGLMVYNEDKLGCMRAGVGGCTMSELLKAAQETTGGGTPTGEALRKALEYYERGDSFSNPCTEAWPGDGTDSWCDWCRKSFVLLITDGEWNGEEDPVRAAREGRIQDHRTERGDQIVTTYTVYSFSKDDRGRNALKWTAMMGSFEDLDCDTWPDPCTGYPSNSKTALLPESNAEWDQDGDGVPDNYYQAEEGQELRNNLLTAIYDMIQRSASGTGVSALSGQKKSGSGLIQALFYPRRVWDDGDVKFRLDWTGALYNWWLYRGEEPANINIREDTVEDKELDLQEDYLIEFAFNEEENQLYVKAYEDADSDGVPDDPQDPLIYDDLHSAHFLWEAGDELSTRLELSRKIYTQVNGSDLTRFQAVNKNMLDDYLGADLGINGDYEDLIYWVRGIDKDGLRNRLVQRSPMKTWSLGDIAYSTPQVVIYDDYSVVFVGSNDGMLHAFNVGYYNVDIESGVVKLQNGRYDESKGILGKELWAFIPKNALPYLRYLPNPGYSHLYYVDLTPCVLSVDYDNDNSTEKVLIGGMRLGGAVGCSADNCVQPPDDASGAGKSSYFALDVTDPETPELLWEFTHDELGFSYSGPGVIKKGDTYHVVFLSGPTNYAGESGQSLKIFVINFSSGSLEGTVDTGISNAFGGRLFSYTEDASLYFGYVKQGSWTGGLLKLDTTAENPDNWTTSSVLTGIGPVTATVKAAEFGTNTWLYFGEGRYFSKDDDLDGVRYLYGVKASCEGCTRADLTNQTSAIQQGVASGWYIRLDGQSGNWGAERVITDPTGVKTGSSRGELYFLSFQPNTEVCEFGGRTFLWRVKATTGGAVEDCMPGKLFVQVSTGQIKGFSSSDIFEGSLGRKSGAFSGVPGEHSPKMVTLHTWQGNIIHWIER